MFLLCLICPCTSRCGGDSRYYADVVLISNDRGTLHSCQDAGVSIKPVHSEETQAMTSCDAAMWPEAAAGVSDVPHRMWPDWNRLVFYGLHMCLLDFQPLSFKLISHWGVCLSSWHQMVEERLRPLSEAAAQTWWSHTGMIHHRGHLHVQEHVKVLHTNVQILHFVRCVQIMWLSRSKQTVNVCQTTFTPAWFGVFPHIHKHLHLIFFSNFMFLLSCSSSGDDWKRVYFQNCGAETLLLILQLSFS